MTLINHAFIYTDWNIKCIKCPTPTELPYVCVCVCVCVSVCVCLREGYEIFYNKIAEISTKCHKVITVGGILVGRSIDFKWNILLLLPTLHQRSFHQPLFSIGGTCRDVDLCLCLCPCVCLSVCPLKVYDAVKVYDSRERGQWLAQRRRMDMCHSGVCWHLLSCVTHFVCFWSLLELLVFLVL